MAISENPTTRESLRRAVLGDLVDRCTAAAVSIEGGALDGIEVVSLGTLRAQVTNALDDDLPPPTERRAEVTTPAIVLVSAICPECQLPVEIIVGLSPQLTVDNDGAEIAVKAKSKARVHVCGQLALRVVGDQESFELEDIIGEAAEPESEPEAETRPCPACGAALLPDQTHWSLFPDPMGGWECPVDDGEANPEGAALPPDAPADDGSAAKPWPEDCPFPQCNLGAEHRGEHDLRAAPTEAETVEAAERIETLYSQAADRVAAKRAGRVKAQGPGFTASQSAAAAAELERDLDGPTL